MSLLRKLVIASTIVAAIAGAFIVLTILEYNSEAVASAHASHWLHCNHIEGSLSNPYNTVCPNNYVSSEMVVHARSVAENHRSLFKVWTVLAFVFGMLELALAIIGADKTWPIAKAWWHDRDRRRTNREFYCIMGHSMADHPEDWLVPRIDF